MISHGYLLWERCSEHIDLFCLIQLGLIVTRKGKAEKVLELSGKIFSPITCLSLYISED